MENEILFAMVFGPRQNTGDAGNIVDIGGYIFIGLVFVFFAFKMTQSLRRSMSTVEIEQLIFVLDYSWKDVRSIQNALEILRDEHYSYNDIWSALNDLVADGRAKRMRGKRPLMYLPITGIVIPGYLFKLSGGGNNRFPPRFTPPTRGHTRRRRFFVSNVCRYRSKSDDKERKEFSILQFSRKIQTPNFQSSQPNVSQLRRLKIENFLILP